jgi:hypothetical protein
VDRAAASSASISAPAAGTRVAAASPGAAGAAGQVSRATVAPHPAIATITAERRGPAEAAERLVALERAVRRSPLRKGGGLVDAPGRWLVGTKGNSPFLNAYRLHGGRWERVVPRLTDTLPCEVVGPAQLPGTILKISPR